MKTKDGLITDFLSDVGGIDKTTIELLGLFYDEMTKWFDEMNQFIDISEEEPEECTHVITKYKNRYEVGFYIGNGEFDGFTYKPTHWRKIF